MLKRLSVAFAALFAFTSLANSAGTVPGFSLTPQFDLLGRVAPGCRLYVIQAGTVSTPQNAYQDTGLTQPQPNPMVCDAAGRLPQWFVADGNIKLRLLTSTGSQIFSQDNLLVVGPSSGGGGGGGGTIDPTTIAATGDLKVSYGTSILSGWVRSNGRTIGSATSGATERANADCQSLFIYLWGADSNLTVSGGRGASGAADWAANKTIALPDWRGRTIAGLDDMGSSAASRLSATYFGATATVLGAAGGSENTTLIANQLPSSIPYTDPGHLHGVPVPTGKNTTVADTPTLVQGATINNPGPFTFNSGTATTGITINPSGGNPHRTVQPTMLATIYIKL